MAEFCTSVIVFLCFVLGLCVGGVCLFGFPVVVGLFFPPKYYNVSYGCLFQRLNILIT